MANTSDYYITSQGVIVPDTSTVLSEVEADWKALFGEDLDVSPETPQGRFIELQTRTRKFVIESCAAVSNLLNLDRVNGFGLDDLGSLFVLSRKPATQTVTTVILTGANGTVVPAGTRLQTDAGDIFVNDNPWTITGGSKAAVDGWHAEQYGEVPCPANTLVNMLDVVPGLESVNNPSAPTLGQELESDNLFRARIKSSQMATSRSVTESIKGALESLSGVKGVFVTDNYDSEYNQGQWVAVQKTIDGLVMPPHSVLAVVDGGDEDEIAATLFSKKTLGADYVVSSTSGAQIVTREINDNTYNYTVVQEVRFARPVLEDVAITVSVKRQGYTGTDLEGDVKAAVLAMADGDIPGIDPITLGASVSPFEIASAVSARIPEIFVSGVTLAKGSATQEPETIDFGIGHKANITAANITVEVVGE